MDYRSTIGGRRGRDRMVAVHGRVYSIDHYVIKIVTDLRQVGGFFRVFRFPPPVKLTSTI